MVVPFQGWVDVNGGAIITSTGAMKLCTICPCGPPSGIYACGAFTHLGGGGASINKIAYWDGSTWLGIGQPAGGTSIVYDIMYDAVRNIIIVVGNFTSISGVTAGNAAYWDGLAWHTFGGSGLSSDEIYNVCAYPVGHLIIFSGSSHDPHSWDGTTVANFGSPDATHSVYQAFYAASSSNLYCATSDSRVWVWNGSSWATRSAINVATPNLYSSGSRTKTFGEFNSGGGFDGIFINTAIVVPPDTIPMQVEWLNGNTWINEGASIGFNSNFGATTLRSAKAYVGAVHASTGTVYVLERQTGGAWSEVTGGPNNSVRVLRTHPTTNNIYAGGDFTSPGSRIASWNGSSWSALGAGFDGNVLGIAIVP